MASRQGEVSIHGKRLLLTPGGLKVDGRMLPTFDYGNKVFYVHSVTGSDTLDGLTPDRPLATLDAAVGKCTANQGDVIVVMPNHAETITGAGGITVDVAGITIMGLGNYNQRPNFLMDGGTSVTILVSAADVTISNLVFTGGHASVVTCFDITAVGCTLLDIEFADNTTNENFLTPIKATGGDDTANGLRVEGCRWLSPDADALEFIEVTGNLDRLVVKDNFVCVKGTASPLILTAGAKILTNALISNNVIQNANTANDLLIDNGGATNTGIVCWNLVGNLDVTGAQVLGAATGLQFFENYATSTSTESGAVAPTADTPNS